MEGNGRGAAVLRTGQQTPEAVAGCEDGYDGGKPSVVSAVATLLDAELDLFKAALFGSRRSIGAHHQSERFIEEFTSLQGRHVEIIGGILQLQNSLRQELNAKRQELSVRLEAAAVENEARRRQIEALRREDEAKLREARLENDQLRAELDAMVSGAKRSDVGLVKAKYKARAKHFQRKFELMEQANSHLVREMALLRDSCMQQQQMLLQQHQLQRPMTSLPMTMAAGGSAMMSLPLSPTSVGEASPSAAGSGSTGPATCCGV
jgi:hypothetical protein